MLESALAHYLDKVLFQSTDSWVNILASGKNLFLCAKSLVQVKNLSIIFRLVAIGRLAFTMRTDALDRFGTRLEQRFTKSEIKNMMELSGLKDVEFSNDSIYWLAVGYKESNECVD